MLTDVFVLQHYKPYVCGMPGCDHTTKLRGSLVQHLRDRHKLFVQTKYPEKNVASGEVNKMPSGLSQIAIIDGNIGRLKTPEDEACESGCAEINATYAGGRTDVTSEFVSHPMVPVVYQHLENNASQLEVVTEHVQSLTGTSQMPDAINTHVTLVQTQGQDQGHIGVAPAVQHEIVCHTVQGQSSHCVPAHLAMGVGGTEVQRLGQVSVADGQYTNLSVQLTAGNLALIQQGQNDIVGLMENAREAFQDSYTDHI